MYNKKALRRFLPGGINDGGGWDFPSGTFKPFDLGSGLSTNIGQNKAWYEHSTATVPTNNSAFSGQREVDFVSNNEGMVPNMQPSSFWNDQQSFQSPPPAAPASMQQQNQQIEQYTTDPNQIGSHLAKKEVVPNEYVGVENKRKNMISIDPEAGVNVFNAGIRGGVGRRQMNKQNYQLELDNADPTKAVGSTNEIDEGDYVAYGQRVGQYRDPYQGQDRNSRATYGNFAGDQQISKYGGFMQEGGSSGYKVGQTVEMEPWKLEEFLAAGGEVDYI